MHINVEVILSIHGVRTLKRGPFPVHTRRFREDPEKEAALIALDWIKKIKMETSWEAQILSVKYDENDITDKVKEIEKGPSR